MRFFLLSFGLTVSSCLFGQADTVIHKDLQAIEISTEIIYPFYPKTKILNRKDIKELVPDDVGEMLQKLPGTNVRTYGALGGLKTVSFRGLGANYSAVCIDNFPVTNTQNGQVNLAQLQVDNIEEISTRYMTSAYLPVSVQMAGGSVNIRTTVNSYIEDTLKVRGQLKYGSFGLIDGSAVWKYQKQDQYISAYGKYRRSDGDFPYYLENGDHSGVYTRKNNQYQDQYYGLSVGKKFTKNGKYASVRLAYEGKNISQHLPGAVILYNETADEELHTNEHLIKGDYFVDLKSHYLRAYVQANQNDVTYYDPTYLNNDGYLRNTYLNRNLNGGVLYSSSYYREFLFNGGLEQNISYLESNGQFSGAPIRYKSDLMIGSSWERNHFNVSLKLDGQYIHDDNGSGSTKEFFRLNPVLIAEHYKRRPHTVRQLFIYRNIFRMPTFNELYYGNIGNTDLLPENANTMSYQLYIQPLKNKDSWSMESVFYGTLVENKILAIPTKNLFNWSMQNIGKAGGIGMDIVQRYSKQYSERFSIMASANYSFLYFVDLTNKESAVYGDQIAYVPMHTGNVDLGAHYQNFGFRVSSYFVGTRYVLNENIPSNEEIGYLIADLAVNYNIRLSRRSQLIVQGNVKNLANVQYAYIRSFVMPGRNYLISIKYEIN